MDFCDINTVCKYHPDDGVMEDYSTGDAICLTCGLIVGDCFGEENNANEVNALGTGYIKDLTSAGNNEVPKKKSKKTVKIENTLNNSSNMKNEIDILTGTKIIAQVGLRMHTSGKIITSANVLFKKLLNNFEIKEYCVKYQAVCCYFISCCRRNIPVTFKDICFVSKIRAKELNNCYEAVAKFLDKTIKWPNYLTRFCALANVSDEVENKAAEIILTATKVKDRLGYELESAIAAGALFAAAKILKRRVALKPLLAGFQLRYGIITYICNEFCKSKELLQSTRKLRK
ncbi:transcription initiation factor IIB-like isoform X1 [Teleopsis dalmanni]|uniref:transcription initiation factor IIB-like isoform X1 n=1 Tax=Teleopsis dalmanni TaxID=139649 RepID=UPI0018CCEBFD|nr:transcription initiation factor IIB-like isoform X1 [Teleopsis dalmanni]XP_037952459.1 transcription initiation factor IIB-like isoform X1 [Teleopsis dalmanni]